MPHGSHTIYLYSDDSYDRSVVVDVDQRLQQIMEVNHRCLNRVISIRYFKDTVAIEVEQSHSRTIKTLLDEASFTGTPIAKELLYAIFLDLVGLCTYILTISSSAVLLETLVYAIDASSVCIDEYGYVSISLVQSLQSLMNQPLDQSTPLVESLRDARIMYGDMALQRIASIMRDILVSHIVITHEREAYHRNLLKKQSHFQLPGEELVVMIAHHPKKYSLFKNEESRHQLHKEPRFADLQTIINRQRNAVRNVYGQTELMQYIDNSIDVTEQKQRLYQLSNYGTTRLVARNGYSALFFAVEKNNIDAVSVLRKYESRMRLSTTTTICGQLLSNIAALHLAVSLHRLEITGLLAPLEATMQDTLMLFTPLHIAALIGDVHAIRVLAPYAAGLTDKKGWSAFVWCAYLDDRAGLQELMAAEGSVEAINLAYKVSLSAKSDVASAFLHSVLEHLNIDIDSSSLHT